jgi:hypothetical protein
LRRRFEIRASCRRFLFLVATSPWQLMGDQQQRKEPAMITTATQPETPEPVQGRILTAAERQPLNRPAIAERKPRARPDDERSSEERKAILAEQVALLVTREHRLEYQGRFDTVLVRDRRFRGEQRVLVAVDESGVLTVEDQ